MIRLPELSYVGAFLSFRCKFNCSYCINKYGQFLSRHEISGDQWINGLNRLVLPKRAKIPITLQGGEPSSHKDFIKIINGLKKHFYIDILTNLDFDIDDFISNVDPKRLKRNVPYASIRVSLHPEFSNIDELLDKIVRLQNAGFDVGLFAVDHPNHDLFFISELCKKFDIDFRLKEYLGVYKNKLYGTYRYPLGLINKTDKLVKCKTTELLIAPDGYIYKCHSDLYKGNAPIGHILRKIPKFEHRLCWRFGQCNPCDIKLKNNRFQEFGSCSVDIKEV